MPILPGRRLGPYEILSSIGAGGMGEVYRARDTRLDRIVAIKVLPTHLADRSELRERFEREARTIAGLNHPHICTLFDIGQQDGTDYLVMEYLEGETLAHRLLKGPLPLEQVLLYAIEISDALDKAHRKGVTHRDLKPGNIMLTKTGTKLLDFGLAKLKQEVAPANVQLSQLPTADEPLTAKGTIVGTLQYMAPEQLEGKEVDARTDIFAFGAVVYEMATHKRAFEGNTQASVIGAILKDDPPPICSLKPMTPPAFERVIKTCLAKDADNRWQSAGDLTRELKWITEGSSPATFMPDAAPNGILVLGRRMLVVSVGALLLVAVVTGLAVWNLKPSPSPQPITRTVINLPPGQQLADLENGPAVALSPDGTLLAYVARQGGTQQLYLRAMDSLEARPIFGTNGAISPFFSPDGQWVGFFAGGKLKKVSASGGATQNLGDALLPRGACWGRRGMIALAPTNVSVIQQVSDSGGAPQPLTRRERGEVSHRWPDFLPGGKAVLFVASANTGSWPNAQVAVQLLGAGERRNLIQGGGMYPRYAPSGHLIYAQGGNLMAVAFDPQRLAVMGTPVPVVEGVLQSTVTGVAQYSFSSTGSVVYVPGGIQSARSRFVWVSRNGVEQPVAAPARAYLNPRLSPDGRQVSVGIVEQESQLWLYDLSRETSTRLTFEGKQNLYPVWTPDGKRIAFQSGKEGSAEPLKIFWQLADGSGGLERLTTAENTQAASSWSPDGQLLAFIEISPTTGYDIWVLRLGDHKAQPFLQTPFNESVPRFSPDGRWLAYLSDESGRYEIYVQPYPGPGGKSQISTDGGTEPVWNPNGRELFYRIGDKMMAVDITTQPSFTAGKPRMLFEGQYVPTPATFPNYDVSPDGQRFLMLKPIEQAAGPTQINVVLNWFEELKRKVPSGTK
jgi:serine/threonine protein kinase/Tol biopolymer transport system component